MIGMHGLFFASREEWNEFVDATGMLGWIISPLEGTLCARSSSGGRISHPVAHHLVSRGGRSAALELVQAGLFLDDGAEYLLTDAVAIRYGRRARISAWLRAQVMVRDDFRCRSCGAKADLSIDHIHPRVHGGGDGETNLQVLCRSCNSRKGAKLDAPH